MTPHFDNRSWMIFGTFLAPIPVRGSSPDMFLVSSAERNERERNDCIERRSRLPRGEKRPLSLSLPLTVNRFSLRGSLPSLPLGYFPVSWASTSSEFGKRKRENTAFTVFCTITPPPRLCHFAHSAGLINYPPGICLNFIESELNAGNLICYALWMERVKDAGEGRMMPAGRERKALMAVI